METAARSPFHMLFVLINKDLNLPAGVLHPSPCLAWWPSDEICLASHCLTYTTWGAQNGHNTPGVSPEKRSWAKGDREFLWSGPPLLSSQTNFTARLCPFFLYECFGCREELAIVGSLLPAPEEDRRMYTGPVFLWGQVDFSPVSLSPIFLQKHPCLA